MTRDAPAGFIKGASNVTAAARSSRGTATAIAPGLQPR